MPAMRAWPVRAMSKSRRERRFRLVLALLGAMVPGPAAQAQPDQSPPAARPPQDAAARDPLGRDTPRGTVLGFMDAARNARYDVAAQYLDTKPRDGAAAELARKLFVVLDSRLSPRLRELNDRPEGSLANPLKPDQDVVGVITTTTGTMDLVLERVNRGPA